jgi:hypothetical protein
MSQCSAKNSILVVFFTFEKFRIDYNRFSELGQKFRIVNSEIQSNDSELPAMPVV